MNGPFIVLTWKERNRPDPCIELEYSNKEKILMTIALMTIPMLGLKCLLLLLLDEKE